MPLRLPALSCSKPSSACLPDFSKMRKNGGVFRRFLLGVETMENRNRVIKDYIVDILEQVSSLMEKWEPYEKTRESLWEMLEDSIRHSRTPEENRPC